VNPAANNGNGNGNDGNSPPPPVIIPNTFTPNGDGINDVWNIEKIENYPNCTVNIFNRYGEKVYASVGYSVPWDGTYKGSPLPTGTYYYVIDLKKNNPLLSGYVAIIK
jgi:gliding motility-associated-like protein